MSRHRSRCFWIAFFWVASALASAQSFAQVPDIIGSIHQQTSWALAPDSPPLEVDSTALKSYRPADAELFREYGFSKLHRWHLTDPHKGTIRVDIFEMVDAPAAYGMFTFLRHPESRPLTAMGNNAFVEDNDLVFQRNRYLVEVHATDSTRDTTKSLAEVGKIIARQLNDRFTAPLVLQKLPQEHRLPGSEKFVMGRLALHQLLPLRQKDAFGIETGAEAAMASYAAADHETASLFIILYPTQQLAKKFLAEGYAEYSKTYPHKEVYYKRDGPMVTMILDSNSPELATSLLDRVSYVSSVSWDPKVQPPTIAEVMLRIFMFCGIMLAITFVVGLLFGVVRVVAKRFFPGKIFDRPQDMEVIRLDIGQKRERQS